MIKALGKILYYVLIIAIVALSLLLIISVFPIQGNYQVKVVLSGSMEPAVKIGSIIILKAVPNYEAGDIITFGEETRTKVPVTHRIVEKIEGSSVAYITKGDANEEADPRPIREQEVIGKVFFSIPYVGFLLDFAKTQTGFLLFVIGPAVLIALGEVRKIMREVVRIRREKNITTN